MPVTTTDLSDLLELPEPPATPSLARTSGGLQIMNSSPADLNVADQATSSPTKEQGSLPTANKEVSSIPAPRCLLHQNRLPWGFNAFQSRNITHCST